MSQVIGYLERFNRKERFILLSHVLGQQDEKLFRLNQEFAKNLGDKLKLKNPIPDDAFVAMDFHLDWLHMALYLSDKNSLKDRCIINNPVIGRSSNGKSKRKLFQANQQDIDLLIAFEEENNLKTTHIVLIEAKADTGWKNKQLEEKASRLKLIFEENSYVVKPHFVLMSPRESGSIRTDTWPDWMKAEGENSVLWMKFSLPDRLLKIARCDKDKNFCKEGDYVCISGIRKI